MPRQVIKSVVAPKTFACNHCGAAFKSFQAQCSCGRWDTIKKQTSIGAAVLGARRLDAGIGAAPRRLKTGIPAWDRVTGGGFVMGSSTFLYGRKGVGKSTLALATAFWCAARNFRPALYVSGEETQEQVCHRARRIKIDRSKVIYYGEVELKAVERLLACVKPCLIVVDSIQKLLPGLKHDYSEWGCNFELLLKLLQRYDVPGLLLSQMKDNGTIMGGAGIAHDVDAIAELRCPGRDPEHDSRRVLGCPDKNRFGKLDSAELLMGPEGLV